MDNNLFFMCSLIGYIARKTRNRRGDIIKMLGEDLQRIYDYADIFHCEPIEEVADEILNFNSDLYYQSREYLALCYKQKEILPVQKFYNMMLGSKGILPPTDTTDCDLGIIIF